MRKGDTRLNKIEIEQMIELYQQGKSLSEIGRMFQKDHTSVLYWVKKYGLWSGEKIDYVKLNKLKQEFRDMILEMYDAGYPIKTQAGKQIIAGIVADEKLDR